ncbi:MAG: hypothetical protein GKR91_10300 [Pseudomonadales bacterium]|nr:hypothetical protein [Pseudomonadales bacterium]
MKDYFNFDVLKPLLVFVTLLSMTACNDIAGSFRQFTYPPDFNYVDSDVLRSRMQQLGFELNQLDRALASEHDQPPELQQQVTSILGNIERIAGRLQAGDAGSSHPFLQDDMAEFMDDLRQARISASLSPARYYWAGRLSGGCMNCHRSNC